MEENLKNMYDAYSKILAKLEEENQRLKHQLEQMQNEKNELISKYRYWRGECCELKHQLKEYSELGTPKEIDDTYRSRNILHNNLQDANRIIVDLVKQLHDLPKKIVKEIREKVCVHSYVTEDYNLGEINIKTLTFTRILDTILKKYGVNKNE